MPIISGFPVALANEHHAWHSYPGGADNRPSRQLPRGAQGAGLEFLSFHRDYLRRVLAWYASAGRPMGLVQRWTAIPQALKQTSQWSSQATQQETLLADPRANFTNADALGRFIENGIHNVLHNASAEAFGEGILTDLHSPQSTYFHQLHGLVDEWWLRWEGNVPQPPEPPEPVALAVGQTVQAAIGTPGDTDRFGIQISDAATYRIGTSGATDVVLSLVAEGNPTPIATDDDSGPGQNPLVELPLATGRYEAIIMHHSTTGGTGSYSISLTRVGATVGATEVFVNGPAVTGSIAAAGEIDVYRFAAPVAGVHRVETQGQTDVVATLLGPNSPTRTIAMDDDSGPGTNALIQSTLAPGTYFVQVRHYSATGTGTYSITVRR